MQLCNFSCDFLEEEEDIEGGSIGVTGVKRYIGVVMGRAYESRARAGTGFKRSSPGGPGPRPFQKKSSTGRARAGLTGLA